MGDATEAKDRGKRQKLTRDGVTGKPEPLFLYSLLQTIDLKLERGALRADAQAQGYQRLILCHMASGSLGFVRYRLLISLAAVCA